MVETRTRPNPLERVGLAVIQARQQDAANNSAAGVDRQDLLSAAETALVEALDAVRRARNRAEPGEATRTRLMPLKMAAHVLGISVRTARRRAKAGAGIMTAGGRWLVDIEAAAMSRVFHKGDA